MEKEFEKLFWDIFRCNGMGEVRKIVTSNALLKNPDNWFPYGGRDKDDKTNFGTFNNQQNNSGGALVEKVTNSIDSLLLKQCKLKKIDPTSSKAPRTMEGAAELFFGIPKGDIGELMSGQRSKLASDNIQIVATGAKDKPDLMIWDNGEGQHPDDFKNTFLSIARGNKQDIAFVQGQYNMGSTGAVIFCEEPSYQLIASKKDNSIFQTEKHTKNFFGWTLVRRHTLNDEEEQKYKTPWYEYFAIEGETIPQFEIENLDINLADNKQFETGSFVKLYSYEMPRDAKTAIWQGLYREFNQLLYKPALPFLLYEARKDMQQKERGATIPVYGNHVRVNDPSREEDLLERAPICNVIEDDRIGEVSVLSIVFKEGTTQQQQGRQRNYIGRNRNIIYILNGQAHDTEGVTFITQELNYRFLKKSLLIVIDCSKMNTNFRSDLFMANRSTQREGEKSDLLKSKIKEELKADKTLSALNRERKEKILKGGGDQESRAFILDLISDVPLDKSLTDLLTPGIDLPPVAGKSSPNSPKGDKKRKAKKETKRFPSIFKINIKEDVNGQKIKSIPLNGKGIIEFETDVDNDYFYRPQEKGDFRVQILGGQYGNNPNPVKPSPHRVVDFFDVNRSGPNDGSIRLTLKPKSNLSVGDEIKLNAKLTSPDGDMESIFYVKIADNRKEDGDKKVEKKPQDLALPQLIKITKRDDGDWVQDNGEQWKHDSNWNDNSVVCIVVGDGDSKKAVDAIAINMDSKTLKDFASKERADSEQSAESIKNLYVGKVFWHSLFLYTIFEKLSKSQKRGITTLSDSDDEQSNEELVAEIFKRYAKVLLHLDVNEAILKTLGD